MNSPGEVLDSILAKQVRSDKVKRLKQLNALLEKISTQKIRDFSLGSIGRICEREGIFSARTINNAQSADYRTLVEAWEANFGGAGRKTANDIDSTRLERLTKDPALRTILQSLAIENRKLRAELNSLRSLTAITIDLRPQSLSNGQQEFSKGNRAELTGQEIVALELLCRPDWPDSEGWKVTPTDAIVNENGRVLFDVGFLSAIRKLVARETELDNGFGLKWG